MAPIASLPDAARPKEIIERTFDVFSGPEGTMDMMCFVKFCESSKKVSAAVADTIFSTVVQNVRDGMNLSEFKAALELCVNSGKPARTCSTPDKKCLTESSEDSPIVHRRSSRLVLIKPCRRASMGSVDLQGLSKKSSLGSENQNLNITVDKPPKCESSFRWSPIDPADVSTGGQDSPIIRRTIRWCPAAVEEEDLQPKMKPNVLARRKTIT
jgi:hypothetical protein